jgi:hypothetical protein
MTPSFQYLIDWDNDRIYTGAYDDISADVVEAEWFLGMRKAYQDCADESTLRLKVVNTGGKYNPENASGVLYGDLKPRKRVVVKATNYPNAMILQNLVSYWTLDETSGTRSDSHGSNHLSPQNTPGYGTGKQGNAASFVRASNQWLTVADNTTLSPGDTDFTFAGWVYLDNKTNTQRLWGKWNSPNNEYRLQYNVSTNRFEWSVSIDGTGVAATATANNLGSPSASTWYFIVCYHDSVNNLIGISVNNGTFNTTAHSTGVYDATGAFTISNSGTNALDGDVDEVGYFNKVLTASEISYLYNIGLGRTYSTLSEVVLWTGWIKDIDVAWQPAGSYTGKTFATISCIGMKDQLQDSEIDLSLQVDKTGDQIIHEVLRTVGFPPAGTGLFTVGVSLIGGSDVIMATNDIQELETGTITLDYYGMGSEKTDAYQAIQDVTAAERGRFGFYRDGKAFWWNRSHVQSLGSDDGTIDETGVLGEKPVDIEYQYGDLISNMVRVTAHPRHLNTVANTMFQLDAPVTIGVSSTVEIEAILTGLNGNPAASSGAQVLNVTFSSGTADVGLALFGEKALIRLTNVSAITAAVLTGLDIVGQELSTQNKMMATSEDTTSILTYGRQQELRLNLRALSEFEEAQTIAAWELARRKDPLGRTISASFLNTHDGVSNEFQLNRTIGDRVRIKLASLGHDSDHLLIGEKHRVRDAGKVHETTFYFEPVYPGS